MKYIALISTIIIAFLLQTLALSAQETVPKEVLIIGTMHWVPNIVKNSYKPLLKRAKAYDPEAIYVERPQADDTLSLNNAYPEYLARVDSLRGVWELDTEQLTRAECKPLVKMNQEDFKLMHRYYTLNQDYANAAFYQYLYVHGLEGSPKPTQEENGDLTAKLAIHLGLKELRSMDNQWHRADYHRAWSACNKADRKDGEIDNLKKIYRGLNRAKIFAGLMGRIGRYVNSEKSTNKFHIINSFRYRETDCEPCVEGRDLWDARNLEMARNIGNQVREHQEIRSVVIVGAGHVVGLREALEREYPDIEVKLLRDK